MLTDGKLKINNSLKRGRKRILLHELKSKTNIRKKRKMIEDDFMHQHSLSINYFIFKRKLNFLTHLPNFHEIQQFVHEKKRGIYLPNLSVKEMVIAKDSTIIS